MNLWFKILFIEHPPTNNGAKARSQLVDMFKGLNC